MAKHNSPVPKGAEIIGMKFGRLEVVEFVGYNGTKDRFYKCVCACGNEVTVRRKGLINGGKKSCGCLYSEYQDNKVITHGYGTHKVLDRTYKTWRSMLARCRNPNETGYELYGGRGIKVCERWHTFENFLQDMGERPAETTLDRIDTNGDYEPSNCRWATTKEQARNRRTNKVIEYNGKSLPLVDWATELGIPYKVLQQRLILGWDVERAFNAPVRPRRGK